MAFNLPIFIAACLLTRAVRFFLVAWLFKTFGPTLAPVIEKRIGLFMLLFVVILTAMISLLDLGFAKLMLWAFGK